MNNSQILWKAYQKYFLELGGKKVPSPYRLNHPFQSDLKKYGKSSPEELTKIVIEEAQNHGFDLEVASIGEIRKFMKENQLGIDCSGFTYWCINELLKEIGKGDMKKMGFPPASKTNVRLLAQQYSTPVDSIEDIKPGDIIVFRKGPAGHSHVLLIVEVHPDKIIYVQSSGLGTVSGVQQNTITITDPSKGLKEQDWDEQLSNGQKRVDFLTPENGIDGVRRLKVLNDS